MRLEEHCRHAHRHSRAGQDRHELALASGTRALSAGLLHRVRGVENHGRAGGREHRQRAHVGYDRVVAEAGAALGHEHAGIAGARNLADHVRHVPRRQELALLHVHGAARLGRGHEQIGLAAEERGNLHHVDDGARRCAVRLGVHVGEHGQTGDLANLGEHRQRRLDPHAASGGAAGAVGLVEAGLVDQAGANPVGDLAQGMRHFERVRAALHLARTGDEREGQRLTDPHRAAAGHGEFDDGRRRDHRSPARSRSCM